MKIKTTEIDSEIREASTIMLPIISIEIITDTRSQLTLFDRTGLVLQNAVILQSHTYKLMNFCGGIHYVDRLVW